MTMKSPANYRLQSGLAPQGQQVSANPLHPAHGNPHLLPAEFSQHSWLVFFLSPHFQFAWRALSSIKLLRFLLKLILAL